MMAKTRPQTPSDLKSQVLTTTPLPFHSIYLKSTLYFKTTYSQVVQISLDKVCYFVKQSPSLRSIHCSPRTPRFKSCSSCLHSFVYISLEAEKKLLDDDGNWLWPTSVSDKEIEQVCSRFPWKEELEVYQISYFRWMHKLQLGILHHLQLLSMSTTKLLLTTRLAYSSFSTSSRRLSVVTLTLQPGDYQATNFNLFSSKLEKNTFCTKLECCTPRVGSPLSFIGFFKCTVMYIPSPPIQSTLSNLTTLKMDTSQKQNSLIS